MAKQFITPESHQGGILGTRTQAVRVGNLIFVGGQMSTDAAGNIIGDDVTTQARNAFDALKRVLENAGATMADVVKHNVYFSCDGDAAAVKTFIKELNAVRIGYFPTPGPTTTEVRCGLGTKGALLLVDAWAIVGEKREELSFPGQWTWEHKLPFVQGWKIGDMVFVGGQRSLDANGKVRGVGDIEVQTDQSFGNLDKMLLAAGGDRTSLMRQNTYFRFFGEGRDVTTFWEKMTAVRQRYMSKPTAAGAGLRITGFSNEDELIQVEGIAVLGTRNKLRLQPANHWDWSMKCKDFTQGWRINNLAFIGGQISADDNAQAVGSDMETQTRNVYNFIRATLNEANLDETDVVKLYIYYYAPDDWSQIAKAAATIERITRELYPEPGPAITAVRVSGFAFENLLIEIEAIAICRS